MEFNVTEEFLEYRLMLRHLWNNYFWSDLGMRDWDTVNRFCELRPTLFDGLLKSKVKVEVGHLQATRSFASI